MLFLFVQVSSFCSSSPFCNCAECGDMVQICGYEEEDVKTTFIEKNVLRM